MNISELTSTVGEQVCDGPRCISDVSICGTVDDFVTIGLCVVCEGSELGSIALYWSLQYLITDILGKNRGHDGSRPLCRIEYDFLPSLDHHIVEVKDGGGHQEDDRHCQCNDQWKEVIVVFITFRGRIDAKIVRARIFIQRQGDGVRFNDELAFIQIDR